MANVSFIIIVQSFKPELLSSVISVFTFEWYLNVIINTDGLHNNIAATVLTISVLTCFPLFLVFCSSIISLKYYFNSSCAICETLTCLTSVSVVFI